MLDALVKLAGDAEFSENLPPTGFYNYSQPIRWTVQISENGARLEESNLEGLRWARPYTGRTSGIDPHPLADEASYALGVAVDDKGKKDDRAGDKHASFMALLEKIQSDGSVGDHLRQATAKVIEAIRQEWLKKDARYADIKSKDWVAFELTYGPLAGQRLFTLPEAKSFWVAEAQERIAVRDSDKNIVMGECAVCGRNKPLIGRIPVGVRIVKSPRPLHSYNQTAFLSGKGEIKKRLKGEEVRVAHIDLCFECADIATQVLNTLAQDKRSRRVLVKDEEQPESLANQVALFWIEKDGAALPETEFDFASAFGDLLKPVAASDDEDLIDGEEEKPKGKKGKKAAPDAPKPKAYLSQLANFLNIQYRADAHLTNIDGAKFALAVFSPNVGRTALREWLYKDLDKVIPHAQLYLNATRINDAWGKPGEPQSINALLEALDTKNPNLTRDLIRTAYEGAPPPQEMLALAVQRFRTLTVSGEASEPRKEFLRRLHLYLLASAMKLALFHSQIRGLPGGQTYMVGLEKLETNSAYLCGRLLAVLEEAQQVYTFRQHGNRLKTPTTQRSFGSAMISPSNAFPRLVALATVAHMPKVGKHLTVTLENLVEQIVSVGGYPSSLNIQEQGKFGLGYWHQRSELRKHRGPDEQRADELAQDSGGEE